MSCCNCCYWNTGKTMQIILKYWEKKRADKKVATTTKHIKCWVGLNQKHVRNIATWQHWCFRIVYIFVKFPLKHLCAVCKDGINFKIFDKDHWNSFYIFSYLHYEQLDQLWGVEWMQIHVYWGLYVTVT